MSYSHPRRGGAYTARPKVQYCRIAHWLAEKDKSLLKAFRRCCLELKLHPRRDDPGVTLLFPEKAQRDELVALARTDTVAATRQLGSLVLLNHFDSAADFADKTPGTLCRLSYETKAKGSAVEFEGGATATLEADFAPTDDFVGRIAVWRVKGTLPAPTKTFSIRDTPAAERRPKHPGAADGRVGGGEVSARLRLANTVLAAMRDTLDSRSFGFNPYLSATVSILKSLDAGLLEAVRPFLDYNPVICFYVLVEPYLADRRQALIPDAVFDAPALAPTGGAVPQLHSDDSALTDFLEFFKPLDARACRDEAARIDKMVRVPANSCVDCAAVVTEVLKGYKERYGDGAVRAMYRDEFRFRLRQTLLGVYQERGPWSRAPPTGAAFAERVGNFIRVDMPGNRLGDAGDASSEFVILQQGAAQTRENMAALLLWTRSTCLLYQAWPLDCLDLKNPRGNKWGAPGGEGAAGSSDRVPPGACWRTSMLDPGLEDGLTFHYHRACYQDLVSYGPNLVVGGASGSREPRISSKAVAEIEAFVRKYGRLPDELSGIVEGVTGAGAGAGSAGPMAGDDSD